MKVRYTNFILWGTIAFLFVVACMCYYYYKNRNNKKKIADISALNGPGTTDPDYYMDIVDKKLFLFDRSDATVYAVDTENGEVKNLAKD